MGRDGAVVIHQKPAANMDEGDVTPALWGGVRETAQQVSSRFPGLTAKTGPLRGIVYQQRKESALLSPKPKGLGFHSAFSMKQDDFSQLGEIKLIDLLKDGGEGLPPHLLQQLRQFEYESLAEVTYHASTQAELKRESTWNLGDTCALMRHLIPYNNEDGTVSKLGRKVVGWLAHDLGVTGQTIRRYIGIGTHYPPFVKREVPKLDANDKPEVDEGGVIQMVQETLDLRAAERPLTLFYTGLMAEDFGLSPLEVVLHALDNNLSPGQLRKWIREEYWQQQGETPPLDREWFNFRLEERPTVAEVRSLIDNMMDTAQRQFDRLARRGEKPLTVSLRLMAVEPAEPVSI